VVDSRAGNANVGGGGVRDTGPDEFWTRLRDALAAPAPARLDVSDGVPSAVIVPIFEVTGVRCFLLTERSADLPHHPGQIAFPGGVPEPGDPDLLATALRETEEETGIRPDALAVIGRLDDTLAGHRFIITPYVARLRAPFRLRLSAGEITRALTPALSEFRDENLRVEERTFRGRPEKLLFYHCREGIVWGATARIIGSLIGRMRDAGIWPPE
jgi:8-oxo-dGTP pyrophosphatase MutT (NUDIX family)